MKKTLFFTLITSILLLTGCQQALYEAIREDVAPEEATVSGNIATVTRYTAGGEEFLVLAANDGLRYKNKKNGSHGQWKTYNLPFELHKYDFDSSSHIGQQLLSVLADSTTLFILSAEYAQTGTEGLTYPAAINLYGKQIAAEGDNWSADGEWTLITNEIFPITEDNTGYYTNNFSVFQTNSPITEHRQVVVHSYNSESESYIYYKLNGLEAPSEITIEASSIIDPEPSTDEGYTPKIRSAVWFDGEVKYFTSPAATTNETYDENPTYYYYTNGDNKLYCSNGTDAPVILDTKANYPISALATTADSILIGYGNLTTSSSGGGIDRVELVDGVISNSLGDFKDISNAQYQITRNYKILVLLNATPENKEKDSDLYAAVTFSGSTYNFDNIGLWSYYPARGNWNRE